MLLIIILTISSILGAVSSEIPKYMHNECQEKNSYMSGSAFEFNLNVTLFTQLLPNASTVPFANVTNGFGEDQVYGLFYCRADVDAPTCHGCVDAATKKITDVCRFSKVGIVWFEECTLHYANQTIFLIDKSIPSYLYSNTTGIVNDYKLGPYEEKFETTMKELIRQAAYDKGTRPGFATNKIDLLPSEAVIRGVAQCTPDILGHGCYTCLETALRLRDSWAHTMVFLPSCLFRYDLFGTLPDPAPAPSPPPTPTHRALNIALMVVLPVVLIVVVVIGGRLFWDRCCQGNKPPPDDVEIIHGLPKYNFSQVEQMTNGFNKQLGKGGFGTVFHGRLLDRSREVAVKMLNEDDAPKQFSNEIDVFVKISHSNLVSLIGYCEDGMKLALIYEYMDKGDLRALLSDNAASLSWPDRLKIAIDTAEGLHYLHRNCEVRIVHRDVKPANILLNQNLQAKVADFGLSKIFPEKDVTTLETRVIGTHGYKAPE
ncbi:hypothetical protein RND81_11G043800 [Saponaria officinalis]